MNDRILSYIGLATRAGKTITGEERTLEAIRSGNVKVVLLASNAGKSTNKRIKDKSKTYGVTVIDKYTSEELSQATGTYNRVVMAISDNGFARKINELN